MKSRVVCLLLFVMLCVVQASAVSICDLEIDTEQATSVFHQVAAAVFSNPITALFFGWAVKILADVFGVAL